MRHTVSRQYGPVARVTLAALLIALLVAGIGRTAPAAQAQAVGPRQAPALAGAQAIGPGDRVYTADQVSNTVSVIDPTSNTLLGTIALGNAQPDMVLGALYKGQLDVHGLGFSPDGKLLAVVSVTSNSVVIIDTATNSVLHTVYVGRAPHEAFFTPDGKEIWAAVRGQDYISVIDPQAGKEIAQIKVQGGVSKIVFRPDGKYAFANSARVAELDVVEVTSRQVVAKVPVVSPFAPDLAASPDGKEVWITHKDVGKTTVLDAQTFKVTTVLDTGKTTNHSNFVSKADGDYAYVTVGGMNQVKVYKRSSGAAPQLVHAIEMGSTPHGLWPSPDSTRIYVGLEDGDAVQVIDAASGTVISTIPIGQSPQALVYVARSGDGSDGRANLTKQGTGKKVVKRKLVVPVKPFAFLAQALPEAGGSAVIRELEGTDQIDIDVDGLPANADYVMFLTEKAGAPFGAVQYVLDFKTDAKGKGMASVRTIVFNAFALTAMAGADGKPDAAATESSRKQLGHLGIWPADPQTLAPLFVSQGLPNAVTPFDDDGQAGPAILVDATAPGSTGPASPPPAPTAPAAPTVAAPVVPVVPATPTEVAMAPVATVTPVVPAAPYLQPGTTNASIPGMPRTGGGSIPGWEILSGLAAAALVSFGWLTRRRSSRAVG